MEKLLLQDIYGDDAGLLATQSERYAQARQHFVARFGAGPGAQFCATFLRTPGRINLIGEHTDYNGGFVLPVALDRDVLLLYRPREDALVRAVNIEAGFSPVSFCLSDQIPPAAHGDWSNYFQGAGQEICRQFGADLEIKGLDALISGAPPLGVPRGAGLSSSTALTVAAALALVARNDIDVERAALAHLCSEAEWYVGTRGGMMDQFSALLSRRDYALYLDCRPSPGGDYTYDHVPIPHGIQIVLLNSGVRHENVRGHFNQRVAECKIGVRLLQARFPSVTQLRDVTPQALGGYRSAEPAFWAVIDEMLPARATAASLVALGLDEDWLCDLVADHRLDEGASFAVRPRCRHAITENARVVEGVSALRIGQVERFGALMNEAHASMSADYGASCPEVDALAEIVRCQEGVLGARITGAGWGGGVVALVRQGCAQTWIDTVISAYRQETGLECTVYVCRPGDGAGLVCDPGL